MKTELLLATALWLGFAGVLSAQGISLANESRQFVYVRHVRVPGGNDPSPQAPRITLDTTGHLRHIGAAAGFHFPVEPGLENLPIDAARQFLLANRRVFGMSSPATDLVLKQSKVHRGRTIVRLDQTYAGLPVFGAQAVVQIGPHNGIESVVSDLARDVSDLDAGRVPVQPTLSRVEAVARVRKLAAAEAPNQNVTISAPVLAIFAPAVLGQAGPPRLVWNLTGTSTSAAGFQERVLLDAHNGELVRRYPLNYAAKNREIHDAEGASSLPGPVARSEGDPLAGDWEVDYAYAFAGDTYEFYWDYFQRDSFDNHGAQIVVSVHDDATPNNAYWSSALNQMVFGPDMVADDVMGHELTHAVTDKESDLIYEGASGAINESLSDIFGEFVDLTNGTGDDVDSVRWLIGEDLPMGVIRNMADPPEYDHPDRLGSSLYKTWGDHGGVHSNSGVNNKLAYLLTDGDTFNGYTIDGLGITRVAELYYEANVSLLTSAADWTDLYDALVQAAVNLNWSKADQRNLHRGCLAVEIASPAQDIYVDWSSTCAVPLGDLACYYNIGGPFPQVTLGYSFVAPWDNLFIHGGTYAETKTHGRILFDKLGEIHAYNGSAVIK